MWKKEFDKKWTEERLSKVMDIIKDEIINAYPLVEILKKSGGSADCYGFADCSEDPIIKEEWVGGIVAVSRVFIICPSGRPDLMTSIEISMSNYIPYYAVIHECHSGTTDFYFDYDEFLDELLSIDIL